MAIGGSNRLDFFGGCGFLGGVMGMGRRAEDAVWDEVSGEED